MAYKGLVRRGRSVDHTAVPPSSPHRSLMVAVLEAALKDAREAADRSDAVAWLGSTDRDWPFSFENICDALDMDPRHVRRGLALPSE